MAKKKYHPSEDEADALIEHSETTDLDPYYHHYLIPHKIVDNGTYECACLEIAERMNRPKVVIDKN